jgi:hypothetical protein
MESTKAPLRHTLVVGKFEVLEAKWFQGKFRVAVQFGPIVASMASPIALNTKPGDWLTFYTEVEAGGSNGHH